MLHDRPRVKSIGVKIPQLRTRKLVMFARRLDAGLCAILVDFATPDPTYLGGRGDDERPDIGAAAPWPDPRRDPPARRASRVSELAGLLGVSDMTVRRDLDLLDDAGLVTKVHGGATMRDEHSTDEPGFEAKSLRNMAEKSRDRDGSPRASSRQGCAIGITAGTTTLQLADHLGRHRRPHRRHQLGPGRRGPHPQPRPIAPSCSPAVCAPRATRWSGPSRCRRCATSTSTWCSWACTASANGPASRRPT